MNIRKSGKQIRYVLTAAVIVYMLFSNSCANTSTPPSGGPKDTIPPVIISTFPDSASTGVPAVKTRLEFRFDEYVVLKDPNSNVFLSPPQKKKPQLKIKGKYVIVTFEEPLDSAKTYNINFGESITDNNEGNIFPAYSFPFSTGNELDSMFCTGSVLNSQTLYPEEKVTIAFYRKDTSIVPADSILYKKLPDAISVSDKWGHFIIRNLKPVPYLVYAFKDENLNSMYDPYVESVAFLDSMFIPKKIMRNNSPELAYCDIKDTLKCLSRIKEFELLTFMEISPVQFLRDYKRSGARSMYVKFSAPDAVIDTIWFKDLADTKIIREFNSTGDSLSIWLDNQGTIPDTLFMGMKYLATDTLNNLSPKLDTLRFILPKEMRKNDDGRKKFEKKDKDEPREDLLKFKLSAEPDMVEQYGIRLEFDSPLKEFRKDSIIFTYTTPRQQTGSMDFTVEQDSLTIRKYTIRPKTSFMKGYDYRIYFPYLTFMDINGFTSDSTAQEITLPKDDNLSSLTLNITGTEGRYLVDLVTEKRDKVIRGFAITSDTTLIFPYIKAGRYSIRITEDRNGNSLFDTGSVLERKQPEKVRFFKLQDGKDIIEIKEKTDLLQDIDMKSIMYEGKGSSKNAENNENIVE